jgi:hypothetical protein
MARADRRFKSELISRREMVELHGHRQSAKAAATIRA